MKLLVVMKKGNLLLNIVKERDVRFDYMYQALEVAKAYYLDGWKFSRAYEIP